MKTPDFTFADYRAAADFIQSRTAHRPATGLILGSGLGAFADAVEEATAIPYKDIPWWPHSQVVGHGNRLVIGRLEGQTILVQQGRAHFYEGWSMAQVTFPVRVMKLLGIETLIVTNAAGGLARHFNAGDLMLITDHINLPGMAGQNPLVGPNDEHFGPRFPAMTIAYDLGLQELARKVAAQKGIVLREGVYVGVSGPSFETPAEIRMLRAWGADAVGMSTVSEVTLACHAGMRVLGISGITNQTIDTQAPGQLVSHEEVLDIGTTKIVPALTVLLRGVLASLGEVA